MGDSQKAAVLNKARRHESTAAGKSAVEQFQEKSRGARRQLVVSPGDTAPTLLYRIRQSVPGDMFHVDARSQSRTAAPAVGAQDSFIACRRRSEPAIRSATGRLRSPGD